MSDVRSTQQGTVDHPIESSQLHEEVQEKGKNSKEFEDKIHGCIENLQQVANLLEIAIPTLADLRKRVDNLESYYLNRKSVHVYIKRCLNSQKARDGKKEKKEKKRVFKDKCKKMRSYRVYTE